MNGFRQLRGILSLMSGIALCALAGISPCQAQDEDADRKAFGNALADAYSLVNIGSPTLPAPRRGIYNLEFRPAGGEENLTYLGAGVQYGLTRGLAAVLRGTISPRRTYSTLGSSFRKGGSEIELGLKAGLGERRGFALAVQGTVGLADTAQQRSVYFGGQFFASRNLGNALTLYFNPKVVVGSQTLVTLGGGVHYRLNDQFGLFGDIQGSVSGDNTYSITDGSSRSREIWGFGVRYTPSAYGGRASIDLGVTNGLGRSTSLSMTPALSGSASFLVNLSFRH